MSDITKVNIDKIKSLAKSKGIKIKYICSQLDLAETYLSNVKNGKDRMTEERLYKIAEILNTTVAYLTDKTDDPTPTLNAPPIDNAKPTEDDLKVALFGGDGEVTDEMWDEVKKFAAYVKQNKGKK